MNEFIVWDEEEKEFYQVDTLVMTNGGMRVAKVTPLPENCDYECFTIFGWEYSHNDQICNYIGKTDINGKKIYADSSIVEFEFAYGGKWIPLKAYFQYNLDELRCEVHLVDSPDKNIWSVLSYDMFKFKDLKIIDTIQENKLGLYNKDKQMIAKILNLLKQLSENELKELFEIIQRRYAVESE